LEAPKRSSDRQALLEVARRMVGESGYAGFNMARFAEEAGVSRRTLYNQFEGKQEVLGCLVSFEAEGMLRQLEKDVPDSGSFTKYLLNCLLYMIDTMRHYRYRELIGANMAQLYFESEEINRLWCDYMGEKFNAAVETGEIRDDLDLSEMMKWFGRLALSYSMFEDSPGDDSAIRRNVEQFFIASLRA
jgi:AcrR family transcriptional regulator